MIFHSSPEAYSVSLEQLSWATVFENVNEDRRKYCRSVYYGNLCSNKCHCSSWSAREGRTPSQHPAGSKWGHGSRERHCENSPETSVAGRSGWPLAGLKTHLLFTHRSGSENYHRPHAPAPGTPRARHLFSNAAPIQARGGHTDDDHAAWWGPCGQAPRVPCEQAAVTWASGETSAPYADASLSQDPHPSLHPPAAGTLQRTHVTAPFRCDSWQASSRKAKVLTQGRVGSKPCSDKTARPQSLRSLPVSGWTETWAEWRERGRQRCPGDKTTESNAHRQGNWRISFTPWHAATLQRHLGSKTALAGCPSAISYSS